MQLPIEIVVGVGAAVAGLLARVFNQQWRWRRKLKHAKLRKIGEVEEDKVARIVGIVRAVGPTLAAPLSGRACVCYATQALARQRDVGSDEIILRGSASVPFVIDDGSGHALVTATGAQLALVIDHIEPNEAITQARADELGFEDRPLGRVDLQEGVIEVGARVAVLGSGTREPDPDAQGEADYRSAAGLRLCLTSSRRFPLIISNQPDTLD
jgi:hypothetical protein